MRTYGRVNGIWEQVNTDANGYNDAVYLTTIAQVLNLNLGESPFYANYGIPAHESVVANVFPTYYVYRVQQQFTDFFTSLTIQQLAQPYPAYNVNAVTQSGSSLVMQVPI